MITRIQIKGFKSIKILDIELQPINILLGSNGAGKSNFISLFTLVRNIYNKNLQNYVQKQGGAESLLYFGKKHTSNIVITLWFRNNATGYENKFSTVLDVGNDTLFIKSTQTAFNSNGAWYSQGHEQNVTESHFADSKLGQAYYVNDRLKEFDVYHFHDTGDTSPMRAMAEINDNSKLNRDGSNIAAFLYYLKEKQPKHFKRLELTIQSIAPFLDYFVLEPNRLNDQKIQLEWREKGFPDTFFNAYHLSDGTLRFICLATLLMQPNPPATIIIDEPELGLHPAAINVLASLMQKASEKSQIILSTQSINLIDNFNPEDIIITNRENHETVFTRLHKEDLEVWLEENYTLGDLWGQNKLGAQPYSI